MAPWRRSAPTSATAARRARGPVGEEPWWDPADQARVEAALLTRRDLGRGWLEVPMVNNVERRDPLGADPGSGAVRDARARRRLTALDEGRAWRQRARGSLLVLRAEAFADADGGAAAAAHRAAWREHAEESLDATWRERHRERDLVPGWVEARWVATDGHHDLFSSGRPQGVGPEQVVALVAAVDWLRIEDHTDPSGQGEVTTYEHLTVWGDRLHVVLTLRHELEEPVGATAARAAATVWARAAASR